METRVLQSGRCVVTFQYNAGKHNGIDIVKEGHQLDYIVAHSDGTVVGVVSNCNRNTSKTGERIYGNYVKIKHDNGMFTLYAHMSYGSVKVSNGQRVSKGQVLGYMGNTGYSFGGHLHFEVRNANNVIINPTNYLNAPIVNETPQQPVQTSLLHNIGDVVTINGVYVSSNSDNRLIPAVKTGTITRIESNAKNPYLLNNGNIGWINDSCIVSNAQPSVDNSISKGCKVKVKSGATFYNGQRPASFVYNTVYDVIEISGDRVVIGLGSAVTGAVHINNLMRV